LSTKSSRTYTGERTVPSINVAGKTCYTYIKVKHDHHLSPYIEIRSRLIKNLNVRFKTVKLLGENREMLQDIDLGKKKK
jgi:hypothetical protein